MSNIDDKNEDKTVKSVLDPKETILNRQTDCDKKTQHKMASWSPWLRDSGKHCVDNPCASRKCLLVAEVFR